MQYDDPTYDQNLIDANPIWKRAFYLSEQHNDLAPLGWHSYVSQAKLELESEDVRAG